MSLAAIDDIDDAFAATRAFLLPFDAGRWLRLAVVAFFVGGAGSAGSGFGSGGGGGDGTGGTGAGPGPLELVSDISLSDPAVLAIVALFGLLVVIGLAFAVLGAIMEFVLVESLRREAVQLRAFARRYWRGGVRLFAFRLVVSVLAGIGIFLLIGGALLALGLPETTVPPRRLLGTLLAVLPVVFLIALVAALVLGLTRDFVVPVMLLEGTTVLGAWRRFWPTLRRDWREYVVYVLVSFVLRLVVGMAVGLLVGVVALVVVLPLGLIGLAAFAATGGQLGVGAIIGLGLLVLVAVIVLLAISAVVQVPVVTYFRYYALLVLGDTEAEFDVITDRREAIRAENS